MVSALVTLKMRPVAFGYRDDPLLRLRQAAKRARLALERVVPDLVSQSLEVGKAFRRRVLGLVPVMDRGWLVTLADAAQPSLQVRLMTYDDTVPALPAMSVQVHDVQAAVLTYPMGAHAADLAKGDPADCDQSVYGGAPPGV